MISLFSFAVIAEQGNGNGQGDVQSGQGDGSDVDLEQDANQGLGQRIKAGNYDVEGLEIKLAKEKKERAIK